VRICQPYRSLWYSRTGSQYAGMGRDLYESFPVIKSGWIGLRLQRTSTSFTYCSTIERRTFRRPVQQPALFAMEHATARHLITLGIHPVAMAGHSLGEPDRPMPGWRLFLEDGFRIVNKRALCMDKTAAMHVDPGVMAATDAPLDLLREMIQDGRCPHWQYQFTEPGRP